MRHFLCGIRQQIAACSQAVPGLPLLSHSLKVSWHQKSSGRLGISLPGKWANFAYHTPFSLQGMTMMSSKETGTPGSQLSHWGDLLNVSRRQCWAWNTHRLNNTHSQARPQMHIATLGGAEKVKWENVCKHVCRGANAPNAMHLSHNHKSRWLSEHRQEREAKLSEMYPISPKTVSWDCTGWITERRSLLHINSCIHCSRSLSAEAFLTPEKGSQEKMSCKSFRRGA